MSSQGYRHILYYKVWAAVAAFLTCAVGIHAQDSVNIPLPILPDTLEMVAPPSVPDSLTEVTEAEMQGYEATDSIEAVAETPQLKVKTDSLLQAALQKPKPKFEPDPIRAMWLALILPGGGQIYNRKYWKLPLIYGGFLGCAYALSWNNQMLRDYSQAYLDIMDDDPNTQSYMKMLPLNYDISGRESQFRDIFKNKKDYYRKYRDMSIFAFAAVYVLAVIDAYVDAELSTFDISRDLSLQLAPTVIDGADNRQLRHASRGQRGENAFGLACRLSF